jgi:hypothetical protein
LKNKMANEVIERDANYRTIGAGVGSDSDQDVLMLRVDPITKYLLCGIASGATSSATSSPIASRDGNYRPICLAWDETNQVLQEVLTDSNGYLLCDITFI